MRYPILAALLDEADRIRLAAATEAQATDLIRRFDASNSPVDTPPALPPRPEWAEAIQAFEPAAKVWPQPEPPPAGKPGRRRTSSWRIETPEQRADKRAKRKAAEKARRRNRR